MCKIEVISLDIFQTLVDVNKRIPNIWRAILREEYTDELAEFGAKSLMSFYAKAIQLLLRDANPFIAMRDIFMDCANAMIRETDMAVNPELVVDQVFLNHGKAPYYDDVWETLDYIKGHYRVILSSDSSHSMADSIIDRVKPEYAFISDDLHCYKGEKDGRFFTIVADKLQVPLEAILHIGDSNSDIIGAKEAGARAVWLNRAGRQWTSTIQPNYEIGSLKELLSMKNLMPE